jgi:hypothetical protein
VPVLPHLGPPQEYKKEELSVDAVRTFKDVRGCDEAKEVRQAGSEEPRHTVCDGVPEELSRGRWWLAGLIQMISS